MAKRRRQQKSPDIFVIVLILLVALSGIGLSASSVKNLLFPAVCVLIVAALVFGYFFFKLARQRSVLRKLTLTNIDVLPGLEFERWVGEQLRIRGFKIRFTPNNDYGVDIIAVKDGVRTAVQVKRYKRRLDQKPVREAVAGMIVYKCTKSMVVTNSTFTDAARTLARSNKCELIDRRKLATWFSEAV
jgi:restriction system protein